MDIVSHALAGACTGYAFGHPVLGAIIAITPDLPIFGSRKPEPTKLYIFTHSLAFVVATSVLVSLIGIGRLTFFSLLSHLVLDLSTHGAKWYPRLLWPNGFRVYRGAEWEFYNRSWWVGFLLTLIWCSVWLILPQL